MIFVGKKYLRKPVLYLILSSISIFFLPAVYLSASSPEDIGTKAMDFIKIAGSVKAEALGNAFTARKGSDAMAFNPAGIYYLEDVEIKAQYMHYFSDISYKGFQAAVPTTLGSFGMDIGLMDTGTQRRTLYSNKTGSSGETFTSLGYQILINYALQLNKYLAVGTGVRYLSQILDDKTGSAAGIDFGGRFFFYNSFAIGVALNGITMKRARYISEDAGLPETFRAGLCYNMSVFDRETLITLDRVAPNDGETYYGIGIDYNFSDMLNLRGGYSSYGELAHYSVGLGLFLGKTNIDFAYKSSDLFGSIYRLGFGLSL